MLFRHAKLLQLCNLRVARAVTLVLGLGQPDETNALNLQPIKRQHATHSFTAVSSMLVCV
jgi:hypothetical protein